jgi:RimJ/RimL family protein N-acetyltransferase
MLPEVRLTQITPDDVRRMEEWLRDPEVNSSWYGANETGEPMHIGYSPARMLKADSREWDEVFNGETRKVYSVVTADHQHIGEVQMVIESPLREAQLFVLIGQKDLWYRGYGTAALVHLLDLAFYTYGLHRAWVDVPEYNLPAVHMCERAGFVLEGRLRGSHPKDGQWYDSLAMGLLSNEYARRRAHLMEAAEPSAP